MLALEETRMEQLGEYLIRRLVGEGGMGKVYEAEERLSKRRVALKVLHPELSRSDQGRRLFLNEMQILAHLEHPNIVRSLASTEVDGELVMVLEFLDGRTLRHMLAGAGKLAWAEAVRIVASVASALAAAHGQMPPIIHRDLKPENIMVLGDGTVKVMDFGIAKVIEAMNQTNTQSVGTLQYMSPEQIDAKTIDHRSDLYCLGLIFYELLSGRPPFTSASPRELLNLQCTAEPPPLEDAVREGLPRGVEQLLFQLLEKAPEDRPYLAQDVVERLEPFQSAGAPSPRKRTTAATAAAANRDTPRQSGEAVRSSGDGARSSGDAARAASAAGGDTLRAASSPSAADRARASNTPDDARAMGPSARHAPAPKDTMALVEQLERPRIVPRWMAIAIIAALSLLAGVTAYALRAAQTPGDAAAPGPTASAPARPARGAP